MEPMTRKEILTTLAGLGVELPPATKMPDEALQKRLRQALNSAQYASHVLKNLPLDPATLNEWPPSRPTFDGVRRGNFQEASENFHARLQGKGVELYKNPVADARQTLMGIAKWWDEGHRWMVLQDPDSEQCAINIRVSAPRSLPPPSARYPYIGATAIVGIGVEREYTCDSLALPIRDTGKYGRCHGRSAVAQADARQA